MGVVRVHRRHPQFEYYDICMIWSPNMDDILTMAHVIRSIVDTESLVLVNVIVNKGNGISVAIWILMLLACVLIATDA
jgi:hypothetical protein